MSADGRLPGRIAVVGAGAVGLYYGAMLARSGQDVRFLMRSDLAVARGRGITVRSRGEAFKLDPVQAFAAPEEIGPCDTVLIALKATSNASLDALIPPLLGLDTALVTLQNGLGNEEYLAQRFGAERVLGALCFVCLNRVAPATVEHYGHGRIAVGEFGRPAGSRAHALVAALQAAGVDANTVDGLAEERWRKLVWNIPFNGLSIVAGGITTRDILADPALAAETRALMEETIAAARGLGFPIEEAYADYQIDRTPPMGPYKPSSMIDFVAGRPVEVEAIWTEPLRRARFAGIPTPRLALLAALLAAICPKPR